MPVKSLFQIATDACIKNVRMIDDYGDIPYHLVKPVLLKVDNPQHLKDIEKNSPQFCGETGELWINFIRRDIRNWEKRQVEPKNPANWHKVYRKLQREDEEKVREAQEKLKADMDSRKAEKESNQMGFVDKVINPSKKAIPRPRVAADRSGYMSSLHFGAGSRTSAATGKSTLNKVKRETREASVFGARRTALSTPTHLLNQNTTHGRVVGPRTTPGVHGIPLPQIHSASAPRAADSGTRPSSTTQPSAQMRGPQPPTLTRPSPQKRPATSVFMPAKKRRV